MADDFADEILRECGSVKDGYNLIDMFKARFINLELVRRAIALTRVRTMREDARKLEIIHFPIEARSYVERAAEQIRAEADRLERQMREDGK